MKYTILVLSKLGVNVTEQALNLYYSVVKNADYTIGLMIDNKSRPRDIEDAINTPPRADARGIKHDNRKQPFLEDHRVVLGGVIINNGEVISNTNNTTNVVLL